MKVFEGNVQDVSTLQDIIGTLDGDVFKAEDGCVFNGLDPLTMKKRVVIIDAGFYSEENFKDSLRVIAA